MKIIFETADIANTSDDNMKTLAGIMLDVAKTQVEAESITEKQITKKAKTAETSKQKETVKAVDKPVEKVVPKVIKPAEIKKPVKESVKADKADKADKESAQLTEAKDDKPADQKKPIYIDRKMVLDMGKKLIRMGKSEAVSKLMKEDYNVKKFSEIKDDQLEEVYKKMEAIENA